jgi:hypothetical protein
MVEVGCGRRLHGHRVRRWREVEQVWVMDGHGRSIGEQQQERGHTLLCLAFDLKTRTRK